MDLSESEFIPLTIKDEPFDDSYGIIGSFSITDLNEDDFKIEVKNEPAEEPEPTINKSPVATKVVQNPPQETVEVRPRRTARKSNNILVSQNAASSIKKANTVKRIHALDEISRMNAKQLVQTFSELCSNEMTKYFAYTCCLMPDVCSNFFTSFGSENDARNKMQKHLTQHVKDLVALKQKDKSFLFTAEAVVSKTEEATTTKKRSRANTRKSAKEAKSKKAVGTDGCEESNVKSSTSETSVAAPDNNDISVDFEIIDLNDIKLEAEDGSRLSNTPLSLTLSQSDDSIPSTKESRKRKRKVNDDGDGEWKVMKRNGKIRKERAIEMSNPPSVGSHVSEESSSSEKEPTETSKPTYIFDNKSSWCIDHNYDVRHYCPSKEADPDDEVLDDEIQYWEKLMPCFRPENISRISDSDIPNLHFSLQAEENAIPCKLIIPILTVPRSSLPKDLRKLSNNPFEECDDIELPHWSMKGDNGDPNSPRAGTLSNSEVYREVDFSVDVTEEQIKEIEAMRGRWTHEHIRTLSKYYLKELEENKGKNRRRKTLCGCKICPNKKFTAITTLYYHYISHTGEKPFKCSKCDKGFTRRHSLNYHAMTHSNTNRFKCPVCLKQFRHTSHYKDHVKQHTGEDECHCKLCNTTFKSKTAFNRHLKTKHNVIIVGSNKASRVMSPSKINQLHLEQEAEAKAVQNSVIVGTVESSGILSTIISNGSIQQNVDMSNQQPQSSSTTHSQSDAALEALLGDKSFLDSNFGFNIKTEPLDGAGDSMPANVILIQPEEFCNDQDQSAAINKAIMRRQPRILKPRIGSKS